MKNQATRFRIDKYYRKMRKSKKNLTKKQRCQYGDNLILFSIYIIVFSLLIFAILFKIIHYLIQYGNTI